MAAPCIHPPTSSSCDYCTQNVLAPSIQPTRVLFPRRRAQRDQRRSPRAQHHHPNTAIQTGSSKHTTMVSVSLFVPHTTSCCAFCIFSRARAQSCVHSSETLTTHGSVTPFGDACGQTITTTRPTRKAAKETQTQRMRSQSKAASRIMERGGDGGCEATSVCCMIRGMFQSSRPIVLEMGNSGGT